MNVREAARYLDVNEKKIYALISEGCIPATRATGKWLVPRDLVDQWLLESAHGGLLADRLVIAGADDPILYNAITHTDNELQGDGLISYATTGTQLGLHLLARRRADACGLHWGPAEDSGRRHPALIRHHARKRDWILVRLFRREQGLMMTPGLWSGARGIEDLFTTEVRWTERQEGAGSQRFLREVIGKHRLDPASRRITARALSERDAAASIAMGHADVTIGIRGAAAEFGLDFHAIGWECFDLAMSRGIYFRTLFRSVLDCLRATECQRLVQMLGGYEMRELGEIVFSS